MDDSKEPTGKAKGGVARARKLSPERRKEIAQKAAAARYNKAKEADSLPKSTHRGILRIADLEIPCFVLEDGRRVLSGRGMTSAIGMKGRGQGVARIGGLKAVKESKNKDLLLAIESPIKFLGESPRAGVPSDGFEATVLQELCEAILDARDNGHANTEHEIRYAKYADTLIRGFARVGIIALVDEATGFQRDRAAGALAEILERFIAKELQAWVKTFPDDYYEQLFRLRGLSFPTDTVKRPQYFGHLTNDIVYKRLAPAVLDELKNSTPRDDKGRLKYKLFQKLTPELGHPKLREHMASILTIMKLSDGYDDFVEKLNRVHPPYNETLELSFGEGEQGI